MPETNYGDLAQQAREAAALQAWRGVKQPGTLTRMPRSQSDTGAGIINALVPQTPLDVALMAVPFGKVVGKPIAKAAATAGITLADILSNVDEAQAGPASKVAKAIKSVLSPGAETTNAPALKFWEHHQPPASSAPTGSMNPLADVPVTFGGKEPKDFTPADWEAFGKHYGVPNMGPLSKPQAFTTDVVGPMGPKQPETFNLPGGTEGTWTYADLLNMKANPINPANVGRDLHIQMQQKLGRTMTPTELDDPQVWNGLMFGMTSPNNPLFPNQMAQARLRLRDPAMLDDLASSIPWKVGDKVPQAQRLAASDRIAQRFGLASEAKGGLGVRGSTDYTRVAELAQMFRERPDFFRKLPNEDWGQAVERIASQTAGLSMKTGSFGAVWQDPAHAAISAIDRHMAREVEKRGGLFGSPEERTSWENRGFNLWNKNYPDNKVDGFSDLLKQSGSDGFVGQMLLQHVGQELQPKFRLASGAINPNIPEHLANADWVKEPQTVYKMGAAYRRALDENQKLADQSGLNLFMSQWLEWDRIRNRFEPHENMFPGLSRLPAPSLSQLREVDVAHKQTGHKTYTKDEGALQPTRPYVGNPSQLGYLGLGGGAVLPLLQDDTTGR